MVVDDTDRRLVPMDVVATTWPSASVLRRELVIPVRNVFPDTVSTVVDAYGKVLARVVEVA
jgi:hypothetical protein